MSDIPQHLREEISTQVQSGITPLQHISQELRDEINAWRTQTKEIATSLHSHLQIYANNGKEAKRLADLMERHIKEDSEWKSKVEKYHIEAIDRADKMEAKIDTIAKDTAPVIAFSKSAGGISWMANFIKENIWPIAAVVAVIIYAIKQII